MRQSTKSGSRRSSERLGARTDTRSGTAWGRAAARAVAAGVAELDARLAELVTPAELSGLRAGLVALCDIRDRYEEA